MKRLLSILICIGFNVSGMHLFRNVQQCANKAPNNFGTTHFIRGYKTKSKVKPHCPKKIIVDRTEPIINGSSAHLLDDSRLVQSFFPSIHNIPSIISMILSQAEESIRVAAFALTDVRISDQLIDAHKKGVHVSVILDEDNARKPSSKGQILADHKISVKCYDPRLKHKYKKQYFKPLMHRKCCIVDGKTLITGSTNFTKSGLGNNAEDMNVIRCKATIDEQNAEYDRLEESSVPWR